MKWYSYWQNNSGGWFDLTVGLWVYVQAESEEQAETLGEKHGMYFDGEKDCPCCGPRWGGVWEECTDEEIDTLKEKLEETTGDVDVRLVYIDGSTQACTYKEPR